MLTRTVALLSLLILAAAPAAHAQGEPRMGGVLKAGLIGEAPTLDLHATTAVITQQITWHIYETLYTYDKNLNPIPMLAEKHDVGDNGRRYTITLRKGVRFHNGKEMTSADVVSSLQHWAKLGTTPKAVWKNVEALEAKDPYTIVFYLKEPSGSLRIRCNSGLEAWPGCGTANTRNSTTAPWPCSSTACPRMGAEPCTAIEPRSAMRPRGTRTALETQALFGAPILMS